MDKSYEIKIKISGIGGTYTASSLDEALDIADNVCNEIYSNLKGKCTVEIESVREVK